MVSGAALLGDSRMAHYVLNLVHGLGAFDTSGRKNQLEALSSEMKGAARKQNVRIAALKIIPIR
jgi:hypothetical protein